MSSKENNNGRNIKDYEKVVGTLQEELMSIGYAYRKNPRTGIYEMVSLGNTNSKGINKLDEKKERK